MLISTNGSATEYNATLTEFESWTMSHCTFDVVPRGVYIVTLSLNAEQYVTAKMNFTVLAAIQLLDVEPASIMSLQIG